MKSTSLLVLSLALSSLAAFTPSVVEKRNFNQPSNSQGGSNRFGQGGFRGFPPKGAQPSKASGNNNGTAGGKSTTTSTTTTSTTKGSAATGAVLAGGAAGGAQNNVTGATGSTNGNVGNGNNNNNNQDPQTSLTLDPKVIAAGFANNGQDQPTAGQVASLTSTNNFINYCLTVPNLALTDGKQIAAGSCNPAPMGVIPSSDNMPSSKFQNPKNGDTIQANTAFNIQMVVRNFQTGAFVNPNENYFAAPQQTNGQGQIIGHSHAVIEQLTSLDQTTATDPKKFAFFKGLNDAAVGGVLSTAVTAGLPVGVYKLSSINTAANHQPCLVPIAQHGSLDDAVYFSVTADGQPAASGSNQAVNNNQTATNNQTGNNIQAGNNQTATSQSGAKQAGNKQTGNKQIGNKQTTSTKGKRYSRLFQ